MPTWALHKESIWIIDQRNSFVAFIREYFQKTIQKYGDAHFNRLIIIAL
jgi:hypothetical protein